MDEIVSHFYLRFTVRDEPGVLAAIAGRLGANRISIESVIQKGRAAGGSVPVVIMTHAAVERDVRTALAEIDRLSEVLRPRCSSGWKGKRAVTRVERAAPAAAWRGIIEAYREFFPVTEKTPVVTLREGNTPLLRADRLASAIGFPASSTSSTTAPTRRGPSRTAG